METKATISYASYDSEDNYLYADTIFYATKEAALSALASWSHLILEDLSESGYGPQSVAIPENTPASFRAITGDGRLAYTLKVKEL